jgi:cytidylate kinase
MRITIGGMPGSGKSTVGKLVAKKLGLKFYSMGSIMRDLAAKRGMPINDYVSLKEDIDTELDNYQKDLGKNADNFIIEGRLSFHFIPDSIKIFLDTDLKVAAERIFSDQRSGSEREYSSKSECLKAIKLRIIADKKRYSKRYGIDAYDPGNFDYVIDTSNITVDGAVKKVIALINSPKKL